MFPNILTICRIICAPLILLILLIDGYNMMLIGLIIFIMASITDFLDGYIARIYNQGSNLGKILDPIADKLLVASALLSLLINDVIYGIHIVPAALLIFREIFVSGLREYSNDKEISVSNLAKIKTTLQMISIIILIPSNFYNENILFLGLIFLWLSAIISAITAYQYLNFSMSKDI
jgi:cardiolipin synthase (CMP-forming)